MSQTSCPACGHPSALAGGACPQCGHTPEAPAGPKCDTCGAAATGRCQDCGAWGCERHHIGTYPTGLGGTLERRCERCFAANETRGIVGCVVAAVVVAVVLLVGWLWGRI